MNCRLPCGSASSRPAAAEPTSSEARDVTIWRNSMRSNSSTRVSANSTNTSATRSAARVLIVHFPPQSLGSSLVALETERAGDDVASHLAQRTVIRIRVGPQPGQGVTQWDSELDHQHSLRLVEQEA
jgi:hypothetical protein